MQTRMTQKTSRTGSNLALAVALAATLGLQTAPAAELTQKARDVLARSQNALITVSALSKLDMSGSGLPIQIGGLGEAQESSCGGLVLDASGLTVVSYAALNPMEMMANAIKVKMGDGGDENAIKGKTELSRIQMRLADGTEIPARLVLKDKELDLAFLVPEPKEGEKVPALSCVKLAAAVAAKELDDIVVISRHGKDFGCQPIVEVGQITSVIAKPRPMYDLSVGGRPGAAVFLPDGQVLGIVAAAGGGGQGGMLSIGRMEMLVLPAAEVMKLADQARAAIAKKPADEEKK